MRFSTRARYLLGGLFLSGVVVAQAQTYNISWYTVAGGGGSSIGTATNGTVYSISGTIGQSDAGNMTGGSYAITGGFWGVIAAVQTPGAPVLTITASTPNVVISWPAYATGYTLQKSVGLHPTNWIAVAQGTNVVNGTNFVTIPAGGGSQFFRLAH